MADAYAMDDEDFGGPDEYDNDQYFEGEDYCDLKVRVRFAFDSARRTIMAIDPPPHDYDLDPFRWIFQQAILPHVL